jgi:hypothetical protein
LGLDDSIDLRRPDFMPSVHRPREAKVENIPANLRILAMRGFEVSPSPRDPAVAGFVLHRMDGQQFRVVVTRKMLLDLADECRKAAEAMPRPS